MIYVGTFLISFIILFVINPTKRSVILSVFVLAATFQYSIAISSLLLTYDSQLGIAAYEFRLLALLVVLGAFSLGCLVAYFTAPSIPLPGPFRLEYGQLNLIIMVLSILGLVLLFQSTTSSEFSSRLVSRSGRGFVFLFGLLALAAALNLPRFSWRTAPQWSIPVLLIAIVFYSVAGYRSFVLFSVLSAAVAFFGVRRISGRIPFALFGAVLSVVSVPVNFLTGAFRSLVSGSQGVTSVDAVVALARDLAERQTVPMANTHLDILAIHLQSASVTERIAGTAKTFWASVTNFLPRAFFPDKGETTGVVMAREIFPQWFVGGEHTSSITVGLIYDLIFNFGILGGIVCFAIYIAIVTLSVRGLKKIPIYGGYFCAVFIWNAFFNIFFDDLGGVLNKFVLIFAGAGAVSLVHFFYPFSKKQLGRSAVETAPHQRSVGRQGWRR